MNADELRKIIYDGDDIQLMRVAALSYMRSAITGKDKLRPCIFRLDKRNEKKGMLGLANIEQYPCPAFYLEMREVFSSDFVATPMAIEELLLMIMFTIPTIEQLDGGYLATCCSVDKKTSAIIMIYDIAGAEVYSSIATIDWSGATPKLTSASDLCNHISEMVKENDITPLAKAAIDKMMTG